MFIMAGTLASARRSADYLSRNCRKGGSGRNLGRFEPSKEDAMKASSDRLLRRTLWGNAVFSVISGAVLVAFATPFAALATEAPLSLAGLELAIVFELLGLGVVLFGAICGWVASRATLPQGWTRVIFAADIAWIAGSIVVLALPASWTATGIAGIVVVALIVADIAVLEYLGLRRLGAVH
jgi:hypothetical protein